MVKLYYFSFELNKKNRWLITNSKIVIFLNWETKKALNKINK
jgi:hypothetical protein